MLYHNHLHLLWLFGVTSTKPTSCWGTYLVGSLLFYWWVWHTYWSRSCCGSRKHCWRITTLTSNVKLSTRAILTILSTKHFMMLTLKRTHTASVYPLLSFCSSIKNLSVHNGPKITVFLSWFLSFSPSVLLLLTQSYRLFIVLYQNLRRMIIWLLNCTVILWRSRFCWFWTWRLLLLCSVSIRVVQTHQMHLHLAFCSRGLTMTLLQIGTFK